MLGCSVEATCSPEVQRKVVAASTEGRSYKTASTLLEELAEIDVPVKQCERITQRIGEERIDQRDRPANEVLGKSSKPAARLPQITRQGLTNPVVHPSAGIKPLFVDLWRSLCLERLPPAKYHLHYNI